MSVYAGGYPTQTVRKYDKATLAYIGETANYGGIIYSVFVDGVEVQKPRWAYWFPRLYEFLEKRGWVWRQF